VAPELAQAFVARLQGPGAGRPCGALLPSGFVNGRRRSRPSVKRARRALVVPLTNAPSTLRLPFDGPAGEADAPIIRVTHDRG
jgi:hypothetical protein